MKARKTLYFSLGVITALLISLSSVNCALAWFGGGFGGMPPVDKNLQEYYQLKNQGNIEKIINNNLKFLEEGKKKGKIPWQVQSAIFLSEVYVQNLKDYSKGIEYGELVLKLIDEGLKLEPENQDAKDFGYEVSMKKGKDEVNKEKIKWYQLKKSFAYNNLRTAYTELGDSRKAMEYARLMQEVTSEYMPSAEETAKQVKETYAESAVTIKKTRDDYAKRHGEEAADKVYGKMLKQFEGYGDTMEKMLTEEPMSQADLLAKIKEQAARGDMDGLRASIKEYITLTSASGSYNQMREYEYGQAYIDASAYPGAADIAYEVGLYEEAHAYGKKALDSQAEYLRLVLKSVPRYQHKQYLDTVKSSTFNQNDAIRLTIGKALNRLSRHGEAIDFLKKSYEEYREGMSRYSSMAHSALKMGAEKMPRKMEILYELAAAYEKSGQMQKAVDTLAQMVAYFEGIRAKLTKESQKISYMSTQHEIYDRIIKLLLTEGRASDALDYVERSRARALVDILEGKELQPKSEKTRSLLARKSSAENRYSDLLRGLGGDATTRERSIKVVQKEMDGVLKELGKEDAEILSMTTATTLKTGEIQKLLDNDTALLEYYVIGDEVLLWAVTRDSLKTARVAIPRWVLAQKVVDFREKVTTPGSRANKADLQKGLSEVRLTITPARFRNDEEYRMEVSVKNNMPLFLAITEMETRIGDHVTISSSNILEKVIPGGAEKLISGGKYTPQKFFPMNITPGRYQVVLHTDQGELLSNIVEVGVDAGGMVSVIDQGFDQAHQKRLADLEKYDGMTLYDILIKPVKQQLAGKRLAVVPHGILHYLPFAAIKNKGRYLIEDHALVSLSSATVYNFCKNKRKELDGGILALGNPDLGKPQLDIPSAVKEVDSIAQLYPDSRVLVRGEATEAAVKQLSGSYNVLHIASHGIFDADKPLNSALLLSASDNEDGRLTVSEIFDLELNAGLVTLSACRSGMSRIKAGDELMGLPRAFIYAGAPSVVASLWNVNDEATADLMEDFYKNMKNSDKAEALRTAQINLLKKPGNENPYYWAAFYLIGDYR